MLMSKLPVSDSKLIEIQAATTQDAQLTVLKQVIQVGWPESRKKFPPSVAEYSNHRDEITEINGVLFKGEKIIVPHTL